MKKKEIKMGMNRTGIATSPRLTSAMLEAEDLEASPRLNDDRMQEFRMEMFQESEPVGTIPIPTTMKGALSAIAERLTGDNIGVLLDKLGERLAFERTGTRLYEMMIVKAQAEEAKLPDDTLTVLEAIRDEEHAHFQMLVDVMEELGADPTCMTPSADVAAVQSMGLLQTVSDPRLGFLQSVEALRTAELIDNDAWDALIVLAEHFGLDRLDDFREAKAAEEEHLMAIRRIAENGVLDAAGGRAKETKRRRAS